MNNLLLAFSVFFFSIVALSHSCQAGTNLAKGKPYTVMPLQNFSLSAPPGNTTALTDGVYTIGHYWTQKTTLGWAHTKRAQILIDLQKSSIINGVSFSTAQGTRGGVTYPEKVDVFIGQDKEHLLYVGDLLTGIDRTPKPYETKRFLLKGIDVKGRYVLLVAQTQDAFILCDEVEVHEGNVDSKKTGNLTLAQAWELPLTKSFLHVLTDELKTASMGNAALARRLNSIELKIDKSDASPSDTQAIEADIFRLRRDILRERSPDTDYLVSRRNLWSPLAPTTLELGSTLAETSLVMPVGGYDHAAFLITNLSTDSGKFRVTLKNVSGNSTSFALFEAPFIRSAGMEYVADPLAPLTTHITLRPGESRMIVVTAKGQRSGVDSAILKVDSGAKTALIPVQMHVAKIAFPKVFSLNSMPWAYLSYPLTRDRIAAVQRDLEAHHTNTFVVPPAQLPPVNSTEVPDFSKMKQHIDPKFGIDKVMLFMNFKTENVPNTKSPFVFMDERWQASFRRWYADALAAAAAKGFSKEQIYLYPFDEMHDKEIDQFIKFATWVRKDLPTVKLYATFAWKGSERALPYVDIAQIGNKDERLNKFSFGTAEKWLYGGDDGGKPAKSIPPYTFYRLIAWKAFFNGYKGIGFWSYADAGWGANPGTAWDDFDGLRPDYTVIYEGEGSSVISSRRWEAWRMGIEDYELLTMYAKAKGDAAAKALARDVLDHPEDTTRADGVRRMILEQL